jgi:hypothetical protein
MNLCQIRSTWSIPTQLDLVQEVPRVDPKGLGDEQQVLDGPRPLAPDLPGERALVDAERRRHLRLRQLLRPHDLVDLGAHLLIHGRHSPAVCITVTELPRVGRDSPLYALLTLAETEV